MKALLSCTTGGPESLVLREIPEPIPGENEVRIAVSACAINYPDVLIINDRYQFRPERPFSPGAEVAGFVDAVGEHVTDLTVGDRVVAYTGWGGLAEKVVVRSHYCATIPQELLLEQAAGLQITYGTALHALEDHAEICAGETLLVLGASGGVGLAAVELGVALGARVIAATSSSRKASIARDRGAHATVIYPRDTNDRNALKLLFKGMTDAPANVVFDPIGGAYTEAALRSIASGGRYLVVGFVAGVPSIPMNLPLLKECRICGVFWGAHMQRSPINYSEQLKRLILLHRSGQIRPAVSEQFSLVQGGQAIARLAERRAIGKVVVTVRE